MQLSIWIQYIKSVICQTDNNQIQQKHAQFSWKIAAGGDFFFHIKGQFKVGGLIFRACENAVNGVLIILFSFNYFIYLSYFF